MTTTLDQERDAHIRANVLPDIETVFAERPWAKSAGLLVAQYWDDEADDAVHSRIVFSQHDIPDLVGYFETYYDEEAHDPNLPDDVTDDQWDILHRDPNGKWRSTWRSWDDNGEAIPLFAAFCVEGASQDDDPGDAYRPYCLFRRGDNDEITIEVVGSKLRPWLDGVRPEE